VPNIYFVLRKIYWACSYKNLLNRETNI
jgi:hypothetical protein